MANKKQNTFEGLKSLAPVLQEQPIACISLPSGRMSFIVPHWSIVRYHARYYFAYCEAGWLQDPMRLMHMFRFDGADVKRDRLIVQDRDTKKSPDVDPAMSLSGFITSFGKLKDGIEWCSPQDLKGLQQNIEWYRKWKQNTRDGRIDVLSAFKEEVRACYFGEPHGSSVLKFVHGGSFLGEWGDW